MAEHEFLHADIYCTEGIVRPGDCTLPRRPRESHKGDYGRVLILGGSVGFTGAPCLASAAAVRSGAGLVYLGVPERIWSICAGKSAEAMPFPLPCDEAGRLLPEAVETVRGRGIVPDAVVIGPGLGRSEGVKALVRRAVRELPCPMVLDADALWAVAEEKELLRRDFPTVVTPHAGEFHRLGGDLTGERRTDAVTFAGEYGCITLLKGHRTVIAFPDGHAVTIHAGNPGMAKGGSGDVLSGVLGALLGQFPAEQAAILGAVIHGAAGDVCAEEKGEYGMTPTDILETIPYIMKGMTR